MITTTTCMFMMNPVRLKMIIFILCLAWKVGSGKEEVQCIQREREALLQFKSALIDSYGMLSSWTTADCCQWKGIHCSNLTPHVLMLHLHGEFYKIPTSQNYVSGEIHKSLIELQHLNYLNLSGNSFLKSHIPEFLGSLTSLRYLDLSSCQFDGEIPSQLGNLYQLQHLDLNYNFLEGMIPSQLGNLSKLQYLDLSYNYFEGKIPSQLGNLSTLQYLDLYNSFKGNIPSRFGNLSNLQELYLGGNDYALDGNHGWLSNLISLTHLYLWNIPNLNCSYSCLQMIAKLPKLKELSLRGCSLSDHFLLSLGPSKFSFSTSLSILDLSRNTFTSSMIFQWLSNSTSNLVELDLSENLLDDSKPNHFEMVMNSLKYLDISHNSFKGGALTSFTNICTLHSLIMVENDLDANLPSILYNLSRGCVRHSLQELNLSSNHITGSLPDLSVFSSLKTLDLSTNQLSGKIPEGIRLPSQLEFLSLRENFVEGGFPKSFGGACKLNTLDLSVNSLSEEISVMFDHLSRCSRYSLRELKLRRNKITGTLPDFSIFLKLEELDLSYNQLKGGFLKSFQNVGILRSLDLSNNNLSEKLPIIIHYLSYARYSMQELDLSNNQISDTLPNTLSMLSSLKSLNLYANKLNGTISKDVQFPTQLMKLDLSSNSLKGVFTDSHFANMSELKSLGLSDNSLALEFSENWAPSFNLEYIYLKYCKLGPSFPRWLQTQDVFVDLDISHAGISDIVPKWFWEKIGLLEVHILDISYNNLQGVIPNFPQSFHHSLTLGSNQFEGPIPQSLQGVMYLDLSNNKFSSCFSLLCASGKFGAIYQLDISDNQLSGQIPDCWSQFVSLAHLNLSYNKFSGMIPTSMGTLQLRVLLLRNNNLTGGIPFSLMNCTKLLLVDMAENRLSGPISDWIGSELQELKILSLANNNFYGSLPLQICYLKTIQLLDLSLNNLTGQIPKCIKNFTSMTQKTVYQNHLEGFQNREVSVRQQSYNLATSLMWKGSQQKFEDKGISLLKSIDLSSNRFSEEIPIEIENLLGLVSLNLSNNHLTGKIPSNIGKLTSLEFLDLSRNQLVGSIPQSLVQIDRLSMLNLSRNHLSGKIPISTQLQSFEASSYEYNSDLCGMPLLEKLCIAEEPTEAPIIKLHEDESFFSHEFYISMTIGFVISFWGVFGSILIKRSWRHAYFKFLSNVKDTIYVTVAVKVSKWRHKI